MKKTYLRANGLLMLTAIIWGFAFVAQRASMAHIGPFTFNAIRFGLGAISLIPVVTVIERQRKPTSQFSLSTALRSSSLAGLILFLGASFQQIGVVYTTAGKAGFITGLYVILVPLIGLIWKQHTATGTWGGAVFAVIGLYLLSMTDNLRLSLGDLLVLIGAFFWAAHVHIIDRLSRKIEPVTLACLQFIVCSLLSFIVALFTEEILWSGISGALGAILYGGFMSVGIAYTLQVVAQRNAHPGHAAIIMSLEAVFALIGGLLLLQESLSLRGGIGCGMMLSGMIISQLSNVEKTPAIPESS